MNTLQRKIRLHDAACGALYLTFSGLTLLTRRVSFSYGVVAVACLQLASPFTGFCPVYRVLDWGMPDTPPVG
jgi:hypothetical protein